MVLLKGVKTIESHNKMAKNTTLGLSHNYPDLFCLFAVNFHAFDFELEDV